MVGFRQTFNLSFNQGGNGSESMCDDDVGSSAVLGLIVAVLSIGCFVGALLSGAFSDFAGRKVAIIVGGVLYAVGGILQTTAFFLWMMFLGRFIGGLGVGILYMVVPVYIAEISPKKLRGRLMAFNATALSSGLLAPPSFRRLQYRKVGRSLVSFLTHCQNRTVSFTQVGTVVNLICERFIFGWRISLSLQILIGFIITFGMLFLPETPRWLVKKHKEKKAAKVLARIYHTDEKGIEEELSGIEASVVSTEKEHFWQKLKRFYNWKFIQRVILGMWLQVFQRAVGGTAIS